MAVNEKRSFILIFDMLAGHWLENAIVRVLRTLKRVVVKAGEGQLS